MGVTNDEERRKKVEKKFDKLIKQQDLTKKGVLIEIFKWLKKNSNEKQYKGNPYELAEKNKSNFYDMLRGTRAVKPDYILPLEQILGVSLYKIQFEPLNDKVFVNKGLRFAAFKDDLLGYKELEEGDIYKSSDEFDMCLMDYVIEFKGINGLLFLAEKYKDNFTMHSFEFNDRFSFIPSAKGYGASDVLRVICEYDNVEVFNKYFDFYARAYIYPFSQGWFRTLNNKEILSSLAKTRNIFTSLLSQQEMDIPNLNLVGKQINPKMLVCNPVLYYLLNFLLENVSEYKEQVEKLLEFAIQYNQASVDYLQKNHKSDGVLTLDDDGNVKLGRIIVGNLLSYKLEQRTDFDDKVDKLLSELNNQLNSFNFEEQPLKGGLSGRNVRIQNGHLIKKHSDNETEYEFLDLMKKNGVWFVPELFKVEKGLDELTYFSGAANTVMIGSQPIERIYQVLDKLRILQEISKKNLTGGKVYVHDDLSPMNVVFDKNGNLSGIIDWNSTRIGDAWEDFIYVAWTWLNIGSFTRNNDDLFEKLCRMVKHFKADEDFKKNFADKIVKAMDYRLAKTDPKSPDYQKIFEWVGYSKIWVELYRKKIRKVIG